MWSAPFAFEGENKRARAQKAAVELSDVCDKVILQDNEKLIADYPELNILTAFEYADKAIADSIETLNILAWCHNFITMIGSDLEMMRKRYDFLSELVKDYKSVDAFFADKKEWFDIVGIELTKAEKFLGVYFELGDGQYQFFSINQEPGQAMLVDPIVMFQDGCCASAEINILTKEYV